MGTAVDGEGNVYFSVPSTGLVAKVTPTGGISVIAGGGSTALASATTATTAQLSNPQGLAVDSFGNLFISASSSNHIAQVTPAGGISVVAGGGSTAPASATSATNAQLSYPFGVAVGSAADLYIADYSHNLIEKATVPFGTAPTITVPTMMAARRATVGTPFTFSWAASVGASPIRWSTSTGALPAGLTLNPATGVVSGTPTAAGTTSFTLKASTTAGYDTVGDTVIVSAAPVPSGAGPSLLVQQITTGAPVTLALTARTAALNAAASAGGKLSYSSATPSVCAVDASGTLTALKAGTCTITITAAATATHAAASTSIEVTITEAQSLVASLPAGPQRFAGTDRIATSANIAERIFTTPPAGTSRNVVIATAGSYADALAGSRLAGQVGGPLLLTNGNQLSDQAAAQIKRLVAAGGTIYVLGGDSAVSEAVEQATGNLITGDSVVRLGGDTRYETAAAIADASVKKAGDVGPIYLVTGKDFADGVSVAAYAQSTGGVVLLTDGDKIPAATAAYLKDHDPTGTRAIAIGGPAKTAATAAGLTGASQRAVVGADRYETSAKLAAAMTATVTASSSATSTTTTTTTTTTPRTTTTNMTAGAAVASAGLAGGASWPDALSGSAAMAALGGPLLLTPTGSETVPTSTASALSSLDAQRVLVFGGTSVVSGSAFDKAGSLLGR